MGRRATPDHPSRGRPRGGRRLPGHQRPADAVRGRHAASAAVPDVPAPLAALDGHRPRREVRRRAPDREHRHRRAGNWGLWRVGPSAVVLPPLRRSHRRASGRARRYRARPGSDARPLTPTIAVASSRTESRRATVQSARGADPSTRFRDLTLDGFIGELGSAAPVPGGGSASAVAAGLGAAPRRDGRGPLDGPPEVRRSTPTSTPGRTTPAARLADRFLALADEDAAAYAEFAAAMKLPRDTDDEKARPRRRPSRPRPAHASRGPAPVRRGLRRARRGRGGAGRPEQRQRLERPQRRVPPRRGGRPRRRGQRPGQPAVGRRPRVRGSDDRRASTSCSTRSSASPRRPARPSAAASRASRSPRRLDA